MTELCTAITKTLYYEAPLLLNKDDSARLEIEDCTFHYLYKPSIYLGVGNNPMLLVCIIF